MSDVFQGQNAEILQATIDGTPYTEQPQSYIAQLLLELKAVIEAGGGGGGTTNYNELSNKPQINSITLQGNETAADLGLQAALTFDSTPTADSTNPVTSGGVKTALDNKQDTLTFDNAPTANSNNPVKSGGIKTAIDAVNDKLYSTIAGRTQNNKGSMELYSVDLDTIITSGFYNAMTCTHAPASYCALIVCGYYMSGYCFQQAVDINTGIVYTRTQTGGTWSSWEAINNSIVHS